MRNHLKDETSPYLLQHADNPVNWYSWGREAFEKAKKEDKPIFLSIGYSTCHWCHVMAHESFEDEEIGELLNRHYVCIKVDKEERPDVDTVYMSVCQTLTGSGGWPTSIFMTPEQKPFFAGTYFPKERKYGQIGFKELLLTIAEKWNKDRSSLEQSAKEVVDYLNNQKATVSWKEKKDEEGWLEDVLSLGVKHYKRAFDEAYGGFGRAPKFPTPHNLLFLMSYFEESNDEEVLNMIEKTMTQMYRGGIFDHIGGGFSRYSTDKKFLAPHFEKMLYDNALLILAYCKAWSITQKELYRRVAEKTGRYILKEMTSSEGGFYSAQDADSEGVEGKYYLFEPKEIIKLLGEEKGNLFNKHFDITSSGNFEGKNIPNLLSTDKIEEDMKEYLTIIYEYRKKRYELHLDDKILASWNGLMISAMCKLYEVSGNEIYLEAAEKGFSFLQKNLCEGDVWYVSYRKGKKGARGLLEDYANIIFALLSLWETTKKENYLQEAKKFCHKVYEEYYDEKQGGFFLYGENNEQLIFKSKETYDGAMPSGNSMMAYNLVQLYQITKEKEYEEKAKEQLLFMTEEAKDYPTGFGMFLYALMNYKAM